MDVVNKGEPKPAWNFAKRDYLPGVCVFESQGFFVDVFYGRDLSGVDREKVYRLDDMPTSKVNERKENYSIQTR